MKLQYLLSIVATMLIVSSCKKETPNNVDFYGIPLGINIESFSDSLKKRGFSDGYVQKVCDLRDDELPSWYTYEYKEPNLKRKRFWGKYGNINSNISVFFSDLSDNRVFEVYVEFNETSLAKADAFTDALDKKYSAYPKKEEKSGDYHRYITYKIGDDRLSLTRINSGPNLRILKLECYDRESAWLRSERIDSIRERDKEEVEESVGNL